MMICLIGLPGTRTDPLKVMLGNLLWLLVMWAEFRLGLQRNSHWSSFDSILSVAQPTPGFKLFYDHFLIFDLINKLDGFGARFFRWMEFWPTNKWANPNWLTSVLMSLIKGLFFYWNLRNSCWENF